MKSNFSTPGFLWPLLALICIAIILVGVYKALRKTEWRRSKGQKIFFGITLIIFAWTATLTVLSYKGFFTDFSKMPPRIVLALLIPLPFILLFSYSKTGTQMLQLVPPQWLVLMQSFRIFVELLLWFAFLANKLPIQMCIEGRNYDVLTGIFAIPIAWLLVNKRSYSSQMIIAFNVLGILLLLNILVIAIFSMPVSFRYFMNEPSNALIAQFPFILLPGVLVPLAYSFHIFSLRQAFIHRATANLYTSF